MAPLYLYLKINVTFLSIFQDLMSPLYQYFKINITSFSIFKNLMSNLYQSQDKYHINISILNVTSLSMVISLTSLVKLAWVITLLETLLMSSADADLAAAAIATSPPGTK
jgi:hypothetical protein